MLLGSTIQFTYEITSEQPFTINGPVATLTGPDGSVSIGTAVVDSISASATHSVVFTIRPNIAGQTHVRCSIPLSDGQFIIKLEDVFATFYDTIGIIRDRLQIDDSIVSDKLIDRAVSTTALMLLTRYSDYISSYALLPSVDYFRFDTALAIMSAMYMRPYLPKTTPTGDLISNKLGPDQFLYSNINANTTTPLTPMEKLWGTEAQELLDNLSSVITDVNASRTQQLFVASGPRRYARAQLSIPDSASDYQLLSDARTQYEWTRLFTSTQYGYAYY